MKSAALWCAAFALVLGVARCDKHRVPTECIYSYVVKTADEEVAGTDVQVNIEVIGEFNVERLPTIDASEQSCASNGGRYKGDPLDRGRTDRFNNIHLSNLGQLTDLRILLSPDRVSGKQEPEWKFDYIRIFDSCETTTYTFSALSTHTDGWVTANIPLTVDSPCITIGNWLENRDSNDC